MTLVFVDYHSDENGRSPDKLNGRKAVTSSVDGDSYIANPETNGVLVFDVLGKDSMWTPCSKQKFYDADTGNYGTDYLYPVSKIAVAGFVAKNDCGRRGTVAKPGELVIFVRLTTWWERFVSGMKS